MNYNELIEAWKKEEQYDFKGWNFSHLKERMKEEPLPWKYKKIVKSYMDNKKIMLDMALVVENFYCHLILLLDLPLPQKAILQMWS